jgi:hypothetical protein
MAPADRVQVNGTYLYRIEAGQMSQVALKFPIHMAVRPLRHIWPLAQITGLNSAHCMDVHARCAVLSNVQLTMTLHSTQEFCHGLETMWIWHIQFSGKASCCQYCRNNKMHLLYSVYYELTACTCFEHYLLINRRNCIYKNWIIWCVLCWRAAIRVGVPLHNTHAIYQLLYMQCLLMLSK